MLYDLAALAAAACWALGGILAAAPSRHFGPFTFTRLRLTLLTLLLGLISWLSDGWQSITTVNLWPILLSGIVGIFLGDTIYFAAMNRLGPRKSGLMFATHSVFSVILGISLLGERLSFFSALGSVMVFGGVLMAVAFNHQKSNEYYAPENKALFKSGVIFGLLSALCQALGTFYAKPAMEAKLDPITASALRMGVSCCAHYMLLILGIKIASSHGPYNLRMLWLTGLNGIVAMGLGMTFIMIALQQSNVATVGMLSALSPVLILPMLWIVTKKPPALLAWSGAILSCAGSALIVTH